MYGELGPRLCELVLTARRQSARVGVIQPTAHPVHNRISERAGGSSLFTSGRLRARGINTGRKPKGHLNHSATQLSSLFSFSHFAHALHRLSDALPARATSDYMIGFEHTYIKKGILTTSKVDDTDIAERFQCQDHSN